MKHIFTLTYSLQLLKAAGLHIILTGYLSLLSNSAYAQQTNVGSPLLKRDVRWNYGGYTFTLQLSFRQSDYYYYKAKSRTLPYNIYASEFPSHPYLTELAKVLNVDAQALNYDNTQLAEYLTAFVQNAIPYESDPQNIGSDFPRFPIETIVDGHGDCEDKAALLTALLKTFGFDTVLILLPGHMAVGILCPECNSHYPSNGKRYAFIEAATSGWPLASIPDQYKQANATLLETPAVQLYQRDEVIVQKDYNKIKDNDCQCPSPVEERREESRNNYSVVVNGVRYEFSRTNKSATISINGSSIIITYIK